MPRGERPLETGDGVLLRFARDLRALRQQAGSPTYRELSARAHYSAAALSDAASGRKLPSLAVTLAYVAACNGDRAEWEARWRQVSAELTAPRVIVSDADERAPYVGLTAFQTTDADRFFGRDELIDELVRRVREHRFLGVFGASGSGKSSILRAGLIAHLEQRDVILFTPGANPITECAVQLAGRIGIAPEALRAELAANPMNLHLRIRQIMADRSGDLTIIVDQFEEVFTLAGQTERAWLIAALTTAASAKTSRARVVLGVRADFYAHCGQHPELVEALRDAQVLVGPMTADQLRQAITLPAERLGLRVEVALVSRLIADATGQPGVLPLVSHALLETWRRRRGTTLALSAYTESGGIQHAVAHTAEAVYTGLAPNDRDILKRIVLRLITISESAEITKRRVRRSEVDHDSVTITPVLETLTRARLITVDRDRIELAHEALIDHWPRLRHWLDESRDVLRIHRQLIDATATWQSLGRDPSALYRGTRLAIAEDWAERYDTYLAPMEREFLGASLTARAREATLARRRTRRTQQLVAVLLVLLVIASVAVFTTVRAQRIATEQLNAALANKVIGQARALRPTNPALALQLTLAAYRLHASPEGRDALYEMLASPYAVTLPGSRKEVCGVAVSPDGRTLAVASLGQNARLVDITDPIHPHEQSVLPGVATSVTFSPDSRLLVATDRDGVTYVWDITDRDHPRRIGSVGDDDYRYADSCGPGAATFDSTGRILATVHWDGTARLWDLTNPSQPRPLSHVSIGPALKRPDASAGVAFGPGGRTLVTVADGKVRLWNLDDLRDPQPLPELPDGAGDKVSAEAVSLDGHILAIANDGVFQLWDLSDRAPQRLAEASTTATAIAFSRDRVATSGRDGTTQLWNIADPHRLAPLPTVHGHTGDVHTVAFSPDGQNLITGGGQGDATVRLTDISSYALTTFTTGSAALTFSADSLAVSAPNGLLHLRDLAVSGRFEEIRTGAGIAASLDPERHLLATVDTERRPHLWDISTSPPTKVADLPGPASTLTLSPDHRHAVTADSHGITRLWDITNPYRPVALPELFRSPSVPLQAGSATFSPDGHFLVTIGGRIGPMLWDLTDPAHPIAATELGDLIDFAAFSPDNHILITVEPTVARIWDTTDPYHARRIATIPVRSIAETPNDPNYLNASAVAFHPDGHTLAIADRGRTTQLWNLTTPSQPSLIATLPSADGPVSALSFSSDGRTLATITDKHTLQLWPPTPDTLTTHICQIAHPQITPTEWTHYLPNTPYQPPCP